MIVLKDEHVNL